MRQHCYSPRNPLRLALSAALLLALAAPAWAQYGSGVTLQVPRADASTMVMDGAADEDAWDNAQTVNIVANWDSYGTFETPFPDYTDTETKLLWSQDTLYVYVRLADTELYFEPGRTDVDQILVGIDPTAMGDSLYDDGFGGAPDNAPDEGPYAYKINDQAVTLNFGADIVPADSGWVNAVIFTDEENVVWGIEAAFYVPQIEQGAQIGFNIGGAQASQDAADEEGGEGTYAFFSWLVCENPAPDRFCGLAGGTVMSDAGSFALLNLVEMITAGEDGPDLDGFGLANAPNPFRASTTLEVRLAAAADVRVAVYDVLGRQVATLADGPRSAGTARLAWDASGLPAGLYVARLEVDGQPAGTRTMHLVR